MAEPEPYQVPKTTAPVAVPPNETVALPDPTAVRTPEAELENSTVAGEAEPMAVRRPVARPVKARAADADRSAVRTPDAVLLNAQDADPSPKLKLSAEPDAVPAHVQVVVAPEP